MLQLFWTQVFIAFAGGRFHQTSFREAMGVHICVVMVVVRVCRSLVPTCLSLCVSHMQIGSSSLEPPLSLPGAASTW